MTIPEIHRLRLLVLGCNFSPLFVLNACVVVRDLNTGSCGRTGSKVRSNLGRLLQLLMLDFLQDFDQIVRVGSDLINIMHLNALQTDEVLRQLEVVGVSRRRCWQNRLGLHLSNERLRWRSLLE